MFTNPSVSDFKTYFTRDFPFGTDPDTSVIDGDISRAMEEADAVINQDLFSTQNNFNVGFMLLSAHNLVTNLRASSQGVSGQFEWLTSSKGVGSVSVGLSIPAAIQENPVFAMLTKTNYGAKYLNMVYPMLAGQMFSTAGATNP